MNKLKYFVKLDEKGIVRQADMRFKKPAEDWIEVDKDAYGKLLTMTYKYDLKTKKVIPISPTEQWDTETAKRNFISILKDRIRGLIWQYFPPHKQNDCALGFEDEGYCDLLKEVILYAKQFTEEFENIMNKWDKSNTEGEQYMLDKLKEFEQWLEEKVKEVKT